MRLWKWFISWRANRKAKHLEEVMKKCRELEKDVRY